MTEIKTQETMTNAITMLKSPKTIERFKEILWEKKAPLFVSSVLSIVANDWYLKNADPQSVFHSAMIAASLDLPINPNLGFAYIVPYKGKASFQMWYKWYVQLAIRSWLFDRIKSVTVYEWQLIEENPLEWNKYDRGAKTSDNAIWYLAYFRLTTWYSDELYMTRAETEAHAKQYSQSFKKGLGLRKDEFNLMSEKTVLKLLLSKKAPLSVEMQTAITADQAVIKDSQTLEVDYVDNPPTASIEVNVDPKLLQKRVDEVNECSTAEELEELRMQNKPTETVILDIFKKRYEELKEKEATDIQD